MIQKLNSQTTEQQTISAVERLPAVLRKEVDSFLQRNTLSKEMAQNQRGGGAMPLCCPRCLKAHIIKKSAELGFDKKNVLSYLEGLGEEMGHNGYYMDGTVIHEI